MSLKNKSLLTSTLDKEETAEWSNGVEAHTSPVMAILR